MRATLSDVAHLAGVSKQTVSNAINAPDLLRADTLERVTAAIAALGYRPNAHARRLRTQAAQTIGMRLDPLSHSLAGGLLDRFLHEVTERAEEDGVRMTVFTAVDDHAEVSRIRQISREAAADGFILTSTHPDDPRIEALLESDIRFISFGRPWGPARQHDWVDVDGAAGVEAATRAALASGARKVALLGWSRESAVGEDRRTGWLRAMRDSGLTADELDALQVDTIGEMHPAMIAAARLAADDPDAIVAMSDTLAVAAASVMTELGKSLPIIGFDNTAIAYASGISSVDQRLDLVADSILTALMGDGTVPVNHIVTPRLERRTETRWGLPSSSSRVHQ